MIRELTYNNRILSEQERVEFCEKSDEYINMFSECIEGICQLATKIQKSENSDYDKITNTLIKIGTFTSYSFCDCIVLTKLFVRATNPYEKSFLRGKLKVQLNESFKKLYGFSKKGYKDSHCAQLETIITMFPGFKSEFDELLYSFHGDFTLIYLFVTQFIKFSCIDVHFGISFVFPPRIF